MPVAMKNNHDNSSPFSLRRTNETACLFTEIKQDGPGIKNPYFLPSGPVRIDDRRAPYRSD